MTPREKLRDRLAIAQKPFSMQVEESGNATIIRLAGSCTMEVAAKLGDSLVTAASQPNALLVVDLSGLDFIESTGLGGLVAGHLRARKHGGEIRLVSPQEPIRELLQLTRLTQLFQVYNRMDEALRRA